MLLWRFLGFQLRSLFARKDPYDVGGLRLQNLGKAVLLLPLFLWRVASYVWRVTFGGRRPAPGGERCCVVVLSYKRPHNIEWLVRSFLRCDFVGRVVVSNNNPAIDLAACLSLSDPRVELIQQPVPTRQGIRFALAAERSGEFRFFISPDDDVFLDPEQIERLFSALVAEPGVPHGIRGEVRLPPDSPLSYPFDLGATGERPMDHLTGYYAFTAEQARRCLETFEALGWDDPSRVGNGEDIVLSFSGTGKPRIHDLGKLLECNSWDTEVATWKSYQSFFDERLRLHDYLRQRVAER